MRAGNWSVLLNQGHHCRACYRPTNDQHGLPDMVEWHLGQLGHEDCRELARGAR